MSITYSSVAPQPTLAWDFNGTTTDYIVGLTGTTTGTVSFNPSGKYGKSLVITNTAGLVAANYVSYITPYYPSTLTVSLWMKFNTISVDSQYCFILDGTSGGISYVISLNVNNFITLRTQSAGGVATSCSASGALLVSQWYHITAVIDGSFQYVYINGVLAGGPVVCNTVGLQYRNPRLGGSTSLPRVLVNGELDDLRIFSSVLTAAQIKGLYSQNGMPGRSVLTKTPIQPGYIYELNNNTTNVGIPNTIVIDASNPDPRNYLGGDTGRIAQWNGVPNLLTLWDTTPFKYYMMFLSVSNGYTYPVNIPTAGTYKIEVLFIGPGGNSDSFYIHIDSDADTLATTSSTSFIWLTTITKTLTAGAHTVQITGREPSGVAAIRIVPSGGTNPTLTAFRQNYTGTPLFSQLSSAAASSAVGAFSLRAVNGTTARAVQVRPQAQFPPVAMTSNGPQNMTGYPFGGSGNYTTSASTGTAWSAFDSDPTTFWETTGSPSDLTYNTLENGGVYIGSVTMTIDGVSTAGEWIQLELPSSITIVNYSMYARSGSGFIPRMSRNFTLAGSNDGTSWATVDTQTNITSWSGQTPITFTVNSSVLYKYFRLVVTAVVGSSGSNQRLDIAGITYTGSPPAQDFYADRLGNLLTAPVTGQSLAGWLGGATGYVATWYDQSGKGSHMSCSSITLQPKIDLTNGWIDFKPTAYFDTSSNPGSGPVPYSNTMNYTIICHHKTIGNNNGGICGSSNAAPKYNTQNFTNNFRRAGGAYQSYWFGNDQTSGTYTTGNKVTFKWDGTNRYIYGNGALQATSPSSNWWQTSSSGQMIGRTTSDVTMNGEMYSIFMFNTSLSDSDRVLVENFS
jgi:hypothetical protein